MTTTQTEEKNACATSCAESVATIDEVTPKYDVERTESGWNLDIKVPGANHESVEVGFDDGILEIKARRADTLPESWKPLNYTVPKANYSLRLDVSESVDAENISANLEDGILHLILPLSEAVKPRSIAVT